MSLMLFSLVIFKRSVFGTPKQEITVDDMPMFQISQNGKTPNEHLVHHSISTETVILACTLYTLTVYYYI